VIVRHYPDAAEADNPVAAMFEHILARQAELIARWQTLGFIHGVMNTDNMLLSGETIDYGPCAFMDAYDSAAVYSSIDHGGRYAYRNQPGIAHWNLACLAQTLLPLLDDDEEVATEIAQTALDSFPDLYAEAWFERLREKFGLQAMEAGDAELIQDFLDLMERDRIDFTLAFRRLAELAGSVSQIETLFDFPDSFADWLARWRERCARDAIGADERHRRMAAVNPVFIARNHLVEEAIAAGYEGYFKPFHRLLERLEKPFEYSADDAVLATPPRPEQIVQQTFCGT
jgi:uncharacterized protein YdiU (UPF0061 family)